jgi:hypothetical protein
MGSWSWQHLLIFESFLHDCLILDSCVTFQTLRFGNWCFWFYIKSCVFTTLGWMISFVLSIFVFLSFFLLRLTTRFMINNFWLLSMLLKNVIIYLKELNMKLLCTMIIRTYSISWLFVFWIHAKFDGHCPFSDFDLSSHIALGTGKGNLICCFVARTLHLRREM